MKNGFFLHQEMVADAFWDVFLKQKAEELLEMYFIWYSHDECMRHLFVLSTMCVSMRLGPNACVTCKLCETW